MTEIVYDNVIEAVRSLVPNHVLLNCLDREGFAVRHQNYNYVVMPDGKIGIINGFSMIYYRGERKTYSSSVSSLYRITNTEDRVIALLKSYDFQLFLETTDEVINWQKENLRLDLWALCQHYDFSTPMLDMTSEIAVAAFFATHKYDWRINQYVLQDNGVGQIIRLIEFPEKEETEGNKGIRLIGRQPFDRPGNQDGAGLWLKESDDLIKRSLVVKFKQDKKINLRLERAMIVGSDIFMPYEPVSEIAFLIKKTNVTTSAAINRFLYDAHNWIKDAPDESGLKVILNKRGITVVDAPLAVGKTMRHVVPPAFETSRPIVRKPALENYLRP